MKVKNSKKINRFFEDYCDKSYYVPSHDDIGACLHEIYWIFFSSAETFLLASFFVLERINNEVHENCKELNKFLDKKSIAVDLIILADFQLDGFTRSNMIKEIFEKHGEDYKRINSTNDRISICINNNMLGIFKHCWNKIGRVI